LHWGVARTRAALATALVAAVAVALVSGGSSADPNTPPALPGLPPPFQTAAVLGSGGLSAGIDAYGDIVDLRAAGPAGAPLIDDPYARQFAGTVPANTGIVPLVSVDGRTPLPLWRAESVRQRYLAGTSVLVTAARFGGARVRIECAATGHSLGCASSPGGAGVRTRWALADDLTVAGVHLDDEAAARILRRAAAADRRWLGRARPLGPAAPAWARRLYERSLLVIHALTDRRRGGVAAGARAGWAYVWPRDAGAVAIALADAGYRAEARRVAHFLLGLHLAEAARFDGAGEPVPGRAAEGDAGGWVTAAARAARVSAPGVPFGWRNRPDYQEKSPGDYLGNALASADRPTTSPYPGKSAPRPGPWAFSTRRGLVRKVGDPASGLDSAAAWAVRPFRRPALYPAARRTLLRLAAEGGRFGIVPSQEWPDADPWTAPTAWSAWSLAVLASGDRRASTAARNRAGALHLLADLRRAATPAGLLPERVDARSGVPRSTTPLAWSHAFAALALRQLWPGRRQRESR
jgi:hypothetical protein